MATPVRHPRLSFNDGNLAILTGSTYFLVHRGFTARHSRILATAIEQSTRQHPDVLLEGHPVLFAQEESNDMYQFLLALYDGM
jgi:hypothetical protein